MAKSIVEIQERIENYDRNEAIRLIKKVRIEHPGMEQVAYVLNNIPLEEGTDIEIINTLRAEGARLILKLKEETEKEKMQ